MELIDCHTHNPASREGIISVAPDFDCFEEGRVYSCGIHPWELTETAGSRLEQLESLLADSRIVAVGECGLDKLRGGDMESQQSVFAAQIAMSEEFRKPLIIHCVRAHAELLALKRRFNPSQPWILHGFRGKETQARELLSKGFYLSFGERFDRMALMAVPDDRFLLETDCSMLTAREIGSMQREDAVEASKENLRRILGAQV